MFNDIVLDMIAKIIFASFCGGLIGLERELRHKPAGLRTNMLICMGSSLLMLVSIDVARLFPQFQTDPSRIAASIVTGIGFIGAGTIMRLGGEKSIEGLTSAATIWIVAAIGMTIGLGLLIPAIVTTLATVAILVFVSRFKIKLRGKNK